LQGEEIGRLIARALEKGVTERRPWYSPSQQPPEEAIIDTRDVGYDSVVVDMPGARATGRPAE
jgi:hypothetical protein